MKPFCVIIMIGVLLSFCADRMQAQPTNIHLNQIELMEVISGKTRDNAFQRLQDFDNLHNSKKINTLKGYQLQSAKAGVIKIDSTVSEEWDNISNMWIGGYKSIYTYDAYGDETLITSYIWDETTNWWVPLNKEEYTYDANGNLILDFNYQWDRIANQWVSSLKFEEGNDGKGNLTLYVVSSWDETTSQWYILEKVVNKYDVNGNRTLQIVYYTDYITRQLYISSRTEFTHDVNGNISSAIYHYNEFPSEKEEFYYDDNGNETLHILYEWDKTTSQWIFIRKCEYTYDANENQTLYVDYYWDQYNQNTGSWQFSFKTKKEYTYDDSGNITEYIEFNWDNTTSQWIGHDKIEYAYDAIGNETLYMNYDWDEATSQWILWRKLENMYDTNGNVILQNFYEWDNITSQLIPDFTETYYYSEHSIIPKTPEEIIYAYPNPASEYFLFDLPYISEPAIVEIFDNQGRKVLEQDISENRQISVSNLAHGLYLYRLNYNGYIYRGKIVVNNKIKY